MVALNFLPTILKELLTHIPTIAFKMVDWKSLISESMPLIKRLNDPQAKMEYKQFLQPLLPEKIIFSDHDAENKKFSKDYFEAILQLFFAQLKSEKGLFLDLRQDHFSLNDSNLIFNPNSIIHHFEPDFRLNLVKLYQGFYSENDDLFTQSLVQLGLTSERASFDMDELKKLFREQFGSGDQAQVNFSLEAFQSSFVKLFEFFLKNEIRLKSDFLFLGVYLVTLYSNLQNAKEPLNVSAQFFKIFPKETL